MQIAILLLDARWCPRHRLAGDTQWRETVSALLRLDARWIAIEQHRPASASPLPLTTDIALTRALRRRLAPLEIQLADHVIHTTDARFSFRSAGLL